MRLLLLVFFCRNSECPRRIFCKLLPEVVIRYAHRTDRLNEALSSIGFALGGRPGAKTSTTLGMQTGADSILRRVRGAATRRSCEMKVRALGVERSDVEGIKVEDPANPTGNDLSELFNAIIRLELTTMSAQMM
ncbi:MAG: hypothetical protein JST85_17985 [Acidobacteria bacterium]|nr:hypothetical protein [Acidobacteriota bacterium]